MRTDTRLDQVIPGIVFIAPLGWSKDFWDGTLHAHHGSRRAAGRRAGGAPPPPPVGGPRGPRVPGPVRAADVADAAPPLQDALFDDEVAAAAAAADLAQTDDEAEEVEDAGLDVPDMMDFVDEIWAVLMAERDGPDDAAVQGPGDQAEGSVFGESEFLGGSDGLVGTGALGAGHNDSQENIIITILSRNN